MADSGVITLDVDGGTGESSAQDTQHCCNNSHIADQHHYYDDHVQEEEAPETPRDKTHSLDLSLDSPGYQMPDFPTEQFGINKEEVYISARTLQKVLDPCKHETLTQSWVTVGPSSETEAQH